MEMMLSVWLFFFGLHVMRLSHERMEKDLLLLRLRWGGHEVRLHVYRGTGYLKDTGVRYDLRLPFLQVTNGKTRREFRVERIGRSWVVPVVTGKVFGFQFGGA